MNPHRGDPDSDSAAEDPDEEEGARRPRLRERDLWTWIYRTVTLAVFALAGRFAQWTHDELEANGRSIAELRAVHDYDVRLREEQARTLEALTAKLDRLTERLLR